MIERSIIIAEIIAGNSISRYNMTEIRYKIRQNTTFSAIIRLKSDHFRRKNFLNFRWNYNAKYVHFFELKNKQTN